MNFAVYTLGCKVNQYETEAISEMMVRRGYISVPFESSADIYIINTCSVTAAADAKNRNVIRQANRRNPGALIAVTGCCGQSSGEKLLEIPGVGIVTGTGNRNALPELIEEYFKTGEKKVSLCPIDFRKMDYEKLAVETISGHTRAFVKIQDGCTRFCAYCIIPFTRGAQRSRTCADLKEEAQRLADAGYKEIVLTGINLSSYGQDFGDGTGLVDAVAAAASCEKISRVRLGSLEPMYFTEDCVKRLSEIPKFCRQFHLAIQSGSAGVLKRMNRQYTPEEFMKIRDMILKYMPDSSFTTDIMVGFPGETEEEHLESMEFARKMHFAKMHVFPYSRRPGTAADRMKNQVPADVKKARAAQMGELAEKMREDFTAGLKGTVQNVLLEERENGEFLKGFSENYAEIKVADNGKISPGEIVKVLITGNEGEICTGRTL